MKVSYGAFSFDNELPPLNNQGIIEIAGESGAGKSQLCVQIMVVNELYNNFNCYYLSNKEFEYDARIEQMQEYYEELLNIEHKNIKDRILIQKVLTIDALKQALISINEMSNGIIIIDGLGGMIQAELNEDKDFIQRSQIMNSIIMIIEELMKKGNVVIETNNAVDIVPTDNNKIEFDFLSFNGDSNKIIIDEDNGNSVSIDNKRMKAPLGNQWSYEIRTRLFLYKLNHTISSELDDVTEDTKQDIMNGISEENVKSLTVRRLVLLKSNEIETNKLINYVILTTHICPLLYTIQSSQESQ